MKQRESIKVKYASFVDLFFSITFTFSHSLLLLLDNNLSDSSFQLFVPLRIISHTIKTDTILHFCNHNSKMFMF